MFRTLDSHMQAVNPLIWVAQVLLMAQAVSKRDWTSVVIIIAAIVLFARVHFQDYRVVQARKRATS